MKTTGRPFRLATLLLLLATPLALAAEGPRTKQAREAWSQLEQSRRDISKAADPAEVRRKLDPKGNFDDLHTVLALPEQGWLHDERRRLQAGLGDSRYDLIILPVEQIKPRHDLSGRLLTAQALASAIAARSEQQVMPPQLAWQLAGGGTRYDDGRVLALARRTGAETVYLIHSEVTGHGWLYALVLDRQGRIARRLEYPVPTPINSLQPLETTLEAILPRLAADLSRPQASERPLARPETPWALPATLAGIHGHLKTPLDHAAYLQLFALLTPSLLVDERRQLFERSLAALEDVDPASEHYTLLKARALFHLFRRPAAMALLAQADRPEERALREYLNGNDPELRALLPQIQAPLLRLLAYLELSGLSHDYGRGKPPEVVGAPSPAWAALLDRAARDQDRWHALHNPSFFGELKGLLPGFDALADTVAREHAAGAGPRQDELGVGLLREVFRRGMDADAAPGCCARLDARLAEADAWTLYRNLAIGNLLGELNRSVQIHASYDLGREMAQQLEVWLGGHPVHQRLEADALSALAAQHEGAESDRWLKRACSLAQETLAQAPGVNPHSIAARDVIQRIRRLDASTGCKASLRGWHAEADFPSGQRLAEHVGMASALPYTHHRFSVLASAADQGELDEATIARALATRFNGHPLKIAFQARRLLATGKRYQARALLEKAVESGTNAWETYDLLGQVLIGDGDYQAAAKAFLRYPGFNELGIANGVTVANHAYNAGSRLFWLGQVEEAGPLYELAANSHSGSEAEYAASQRLALVDGDYESALAYAFHRGRRHGSAEAIRDYLGYLSMLGLTEQSEAGFRVLAPRYRDPHLWSSLQVGQRMNGLTFDAITDWARHYLDQPDTAHLRRQARRYLISQAVEDRRPGGGELEQLRRLGDGEATPKAVPSGIHGLLAGSGRKPSCPASGVDEYSGFLSAFVELQQGRRADALQGFLQLDCFHDLLAQKSLRYALPYLAMSTDAKADAALLEALLGALDQAGDEHDFDFALARAVIHGQRGDGKEALAALVDAHHHLPPTEWRPVGSRYQLVATAEWLYGLTGDERFIARAVDWSRRHTRVEPQAGWAYAFEALYGKSGKPARIRAAAFAAYLDPRSAWLGRVPADIRASADQWWKTNNPFSEPGRKLKEQQAGR